MSTSKDLDALFADAELPFGHPGRQFDDTPEYFDHSPLIDQGSEPDYSPDAVDVVVNYAPGDRPLYGNDSVIPAPPAPASRQDRSTSPGLPFDDSSLLRISTRMPDHVNEPLSA